MSRAGRSAQTRAETLRNSRRERLRRSWPIALLAVAVIAVLGYLLPIVVFRGMSLVLKTLAPDSGGLDPPGFLTTLSFATGTLFALGAATGLIRPSRSEEAWSKGASGERRVGRALDALRKKGVHALHDRAIPGSRANIDHIAVTPSGVFTIDAKRYAGKLEVRRRSQLWIKGRDLSKLLDQARHQAEVVRAALAKEGVRDVPVTPMLCFVDTIVPLLFPKSVGGVTICTLRSLPRHIHHSRAIRLNSVQTAGIASKLDGALPEMEPRLESSSDD